MKLILMIGAVALSSSLAAADEQQQQQQSLVAACNVQIGQNMLALGQAQQENIQLQATIADLEKQLADLKASLPGKNNGAIPAKP